MMLNFLLILFVVMMLNTCCLISEKFEDFDSHLYSSFECGFSSYFFSRYSFSIHYFILTLMFLFFDLELCFLFPFFIEFSYSYFINISLVFFFSFMTFILIVEWMSKNFEWVY